MQAEKMEMREQVRERQGERVVLVYGFLDETQHEQQSRMAEMATLVASSGGEVVAEAVQHVRAFSPRTLIGSGKVGEIAALCAEKDIDLVLFEKKLTGAQMKNLRDELGVRVMDRIDLILDIFALRARTKQAKLEVMLAQLRYRLPKLKGYGSGLSRTGAGIGTRGPGEQKLETDRRTILRQISAIKWQLSKLRDQDRLTAKRRRDANLPIVALAGYTNVGKSTLMNGLLRAYGQEEKQVYADDRLFATLETSMRRIAQIGDEAYILADTIGFIRELPEYLQDAFAGTLDEIRCADLIAIVIDSGNEAYAEQIRTVEAQIAALNCEAPICYIMNKSDVATPPFATPAEDTIRISAADPQDIARVQSWLLDRLYGSRKRVDIRASYHWLGKHQKLMAEGALADVVSEADGVRATLTVRDRGEYRELYNAIAAGNHRN